ncbi:MAG: hypothetical protein HC836_19270 [Richelia sp. RM2_1_2]|nr:hypothetical protein [Richelia sp. RM2_1_2]
MQIYNDTRKSNKYENRYYDEEVTSKEQQYGYSVRRNSKREGIIGGTGLMGAAVLLMIIDMSLHGILISGLLIAAGIVVMLPKETNIVLSKLDRWQKKYKVNVLAILCAFVSVVFVIDFAVAPAKAQFFQAAQEWMGGAFEGIDETVVELFFNVLRAIFLLYLGISIVKVVQAARQEEDWQNLARTPFIIVVAVVTADIITGMIVGGGGGAAP